MAGRFGIITIYGNDFFEKCERRDDWHPKNTAGNRAHMSGFMAKAVHVSSAYHNF